MPVQTLKERQKTEVAGKDKRSTTADRQTLIDGLNHDLAGEYQAILMYIHYSAKLTGPYRRELRALFQAEIGDEQGHAQFLSDKIAALGGEPTTQPRPVPTAQQPREMLAQALAAEKQAITDYSARIRQAGAFGDFGLKVELENQVADETRHKEEIERILAGWDEPNLEGAREEGRSETKKMERAREDGKNDAKNEARWQDDGGQGVDAADQNHGFRW